MDTGDCKKFGKEGEGRGGEGVNTVDCKKGVVHVLSYYLSLCVDPVSEDIYTYIYI